jgi:hypothetical protein
MNEEEIKNQAIVDTIISQRNEALNTVANLRGELQIVRIKLALLEKQNEKKKENDK